MLPVAMNMNMQGLYIKTVLYKANIIYFYRSNIVIFKNAMLKQTTQQILR